MLKSLTVLSRSLKTAVLLGATLVLGGTLASGCGTTEINESGGETHFLVACENDKTCVAIDPSWHCRGGYCREPEAGGGLSDASTGFEGSQDGGNTPAGSGGQQGSSPGSGGMGGVPNVDQMPPTGDITDATLPDNQPEEPTDTDPPSTNDPDDPAEIPEPPLVTSTCYTNDDCDECEVCQHESDAGVDAAQSLGSCVVAAKDTPCSSDSDACTADVCDGISPVCLHKLQPECSSCDLQFLPRINTIASSTTGTNSAAKAIDNNTTGTRWESLHGIDPQWIYVDLGANMDIRQVKLDWETASGKNYTISVASDGATGLNTDAPWTTVYTSPTHTISPNHRIDTITVTTVARYVRMKGSARMTFYGYSLWDFAIRGTTSTNCCPAVSVPAVAAVASTVQGGNVATYAIDGVTSSRWESVHASDPQWIYLDLGADTEIDSVAIDWESASAATYQIQVAPNGTCVGTGVGCLGTNTPWITLADVVNPDHFTHDVDTVFVGATGRYVRMYGTTRTGNYGYSLFEFSVLGADDACNVVDGGSP